MINKQHIATEEHPSFSRQSLQPKQYLLYSALESPQEQEALLLSKGEDGLYFETPEFLKHGIRIQLIISDSDFAEENQEGLQKCYWAMVRWCHELQSAVQWCYGVGVKLLSNKCQCCHHFMPYERIHFTENKMLLCDDCFRELQLLRPGRLKASLTNHLLGNVL